MLDWRASPKLMRSSVFFLAPALCALTLMGQSTSTKTPSNGTSTSATSPGAGLRPRGPEAVAKQEPSKVVATIDGKPITAKQAADLLSSLSPDQRRQVEANLAQVVQQMYIQEAFAADAAKENLDQQAPYKLQLQMARSNILARAYLANLTKNPDAAKQAQAYYDAHPADFDEVSVSAIAIAYNAPGTPANSAKVTRTESEAQAKALDIEKKIKAGGDFSAVARTDSDDQQSAAKGGQMQPFVMASDNIPEEIKSAVSKLQPGQVSEPARGRGAYFILKLDNRTRVGFDRLKDNLVQKLALDKYKIHVDDQDFFSGASATNIPSLARPNLGTGPSSKP